jgi:D-alanine-D-alanine ligase
MQDLTTGSLTRHLLKTTSFMLVSMIFQTLYILVDLFWVGRLGTDAIAERFIQGRELYVGVMGNYRLEVLPIWELLFTKMPEDAPRFATAKVKWDRKYQEKWGIKSESAKDLPAGMAEQITRVCKRIYRCLSLTGYARIDIRMTPEGQLYVLEANPNPQLALGEDFAESARAAGVSYEVLLQRILHLGLTRAPASA